MSPAPPRALQLALVLAVVALEASGGEPVAEPSVVPPSSCVDYHSQLEGAALEPTRHTAEDVHFQRGFSCHDCHGGNPAAGLDGDIGAAHDEGKGWTGKPRRLQVPTLCARCHADAAFMKRFNPQARVDQLSEYRTSVHGKRVAAGDEKVAVCIDCHGTHPVRPIKDSRSPVHPTHVADTCARCHNDVERMRPYGLPSNQYAGYKGSVHAHALYDRGDLSAPTCNDCHGSHGATPPGVKSVVNVCGSCHPREATLFRDVEKKKGLDLTPCIQCMVCHDNHAVRPPDDEMFGVGPKSTCTACHGPADPPYQAIEEMARARERLKGRFAEAKSLLDRAERAGVEVSVDQFTLRRAQDQLVELRVLTHSFDPERYQAVAQEGLKTSEQGVSAGRRAFAELRQRRIGLGVSLVVIAAVIAGLVLKVREIEGQSEPL